MELAKSRTLDVVAPDGITYTLREQNGNDDDVLSTLGDARNNTSLDKFLSGVIVGPKKLSWEEIHKTMGSATKYYLVMRSRIFTHGSIVTFKHKFEDGTIQEFEEDLTIFDRDLSKEPKEDEVENPEIDRIQRYPEIPFRLTQALVIGEKKIRYQLMTSEVEAVTMGIPRENISKNDELRARKLTQLIDTRELVIQNFRDFSASDMKAIWAHIRENDINFSLVTKVQTKDKKSTEYTSLLTVPEFFFPL